MISPIRSSLVFSLLLLMFGCSAKQQTPDIKLVEVKVPVVYRIDRPDRPVFTSNDTSVTYLVKVLSYTEKLEVIIDEHNNKATD